MKTEHTPFSSPQSTPAANTDEYTYVHGFGFAPPPPAPTKAQMIRSYSSGIGLALIAYFLLSNFMPVILASASALVTPTLELLGIYRVAPEVERYLLQDISFIISMFVPFWFYAYVIRMPMKAALPIRSAALPPALGAVPIILACTVIGTMAAKLMELLFTMVGIMPVLPTFAMPGTLPAQVLYLLRLCVLAPVLEELVFRGFLMQSLRRFGDSFALICSALIFSLAHANMIQMPNAFITGLAMGYFALHTGSLIPVIVAHVLNNTIAVSVTLLTAPMMPSEQAFISSGVSVLYLMSGMAAFLILLRTRPKMFTLISNQEDEEMAGGAKYKALFLSLPMIVVVLIVAALTAQYMVRI